MSSRGWQLPGLGALAATLLALFTLFFAWVVARIALTGTATAGSLVKQLLGWALLLVPVFALLGAALGRRLAREVRAAQRALQAHLPEVPSRIAEVREVGVAAERMRDELGRRLSALDAQRSTLAVLVDSVSDGLLRIDAAGRIVFANPACRALLELLPSSLGQSYSAVLRNAELRSMVQLALAGGDVGSGEITVGERRVLVSVQPIRGEQTGGGIVLALADLTALRRLEGVRRDFVANVSHELKTPLTSIRGYAETLLHDELTPELRRQFLEVVQKNAQRLQQIVDDLLDLARIESGGWEPEPQRVEAAELVRDVWTSCRHLAERRNLRLVAPVEPVYVRADPGALRQVLTNLLDNAIRYSPEGGSIEVCVGPAAAQGMRHGPAVQLEVRDTGSGIPRDALPRIFERFYRVDPARSRAEGGTGLGLAIVKHLVESMGGTVSAQSELGRGTTLRITLPAA